MAEIKIENPAPDSCSSLQEKRKESEKRIERGEKNKKESKWVLPTTSVHKMGLNPFEPQGTQNQFENKNTF